MAYSVVHFGPLEIREYADGFVYIANVACGAMSPSAEHITPKDCRRLTIDPARVTCLKCRAAIEAKSLTVPHIDRVRDNNSSPINPSEYDEDKVKLVRSLVGLPEELPPLERRRQLHRWSILDSIQSASSLSDRGREELEKVRAYRARWAAMNTPRLGEAPDRPAAILPAAPSLSGKKLHLWPKQISEYADGYTHAAGTGCGDRQTADSEDDQFFADDLTSDPALVTCATCRKSKLFNQAEANPAGWVEQAVHRIPRMRTAVLKHPERYEIDRNNALRARIGLPNVVRNEAAFNLIAAELDQQEYYANHRIESGKTRRKHLEEMLNDLHETTQPEEPVVQSEPQKMQPVAPPPAAEDSAPFPIWVIGVGAMAFILLMKALFR